MMDGNLDHLRLILATLHEILQEIFVIPKVREEKRKAILELKGTVLEEKAANGKVVQPPNSPPAADAGKRRG